MGNIEKIVSAKLRAFRAEKKLSQEQMATKLMTAQATLSRWERSVVLPSAYDLWAIADLMGCTMDELVGRV